MSLTEILQQVEASGQRQAEATAAEAREAVERIAAEARAEGERLAEEIAAETERRIAVLEQREIPTAELEVTRRRLTMRRELLNDFQAAALERLAQLSGDDLAEFYRRLLADAPAQGTLCCRKADAKLLGELCKLPQGVPLDEPGLIIETDNYRLDYRFATLVAQAWQEHLPAVNEILFSDG